MDDSPDSAGGFPPPLPMLETEPTVRADAVRNRAAILAAAQRLLANEGARALTMDAIACEARVGKGTLFRRFGDRAALFHALLDERERTLQEAVLRGARAARSGRAARGAPERVRRGAPRPAR